MLADRLGFIVINEIPAVGLNFEDPEEMTAQRLTQCQQQIRELIARHASTIIVAKPPECLATRSELSRFLNAEDAEKRRGKTASYEKPSASLCVLCALCVKAHPTSRNQS